MTFERALAFTAKIEAGWTPDRKTRFGIDQRFHPGVDLEKLTPAGAAEILRNEYWLPIRGGELPWPLALIVFDQAVHDGPPDAVKLLQELVGAKVDGRCGPRTLEAVRRAPLAELCAQMLKRRGAVLDAGGRNVSGFRARVRDLAVEAIRQMEVKAA